MGSGCFCDPAFTSNAHASVKFPNKGILFKGGFCIAIAVVTCTVPIFNWHFSGLCTTSHVHLISEMGESGIRERTRGFISWRAWSYSENLMAIVLPEDWSLELPPFGFILSELQDNLTRPFQDTISFLKPKSLKNPNNYHYSMQGLPWEIRRGGTSARPWPISSDYPFYAVKCIQYYLPKCTVCTFYKCIPF